MLSFVHTLQPPPHHHHHHRPSKLAIRPHTLIRSHAPRLNSHELTPPPLTTGRTILVRPHIRIPRAAAAVPGSDDDTSSTAAEQVQRGQESQPNTTSTTPEQKPKPEAEQSRLIAPSLSVQKQESGDAINTPGAAAAEVVVVDVDDDEEEEEPSDLQSNPVSSGARKDEGDVATKKKESSRVQLGLVFGLWYFQNVVFNIYNKKVLNLFPYPWLLASFQLLLGSLWMAALWATGIQPRPRASRRFLAALLGPALFHAIGHISACVSFSHAAVSFTHVIKSAEPVFSVAISALHGYFYPLHVWLAVLPIVAGCSLAAVTEVAFSPAGLWGALISNVGFVLRNIYSKQSLHDFQHIDGLNLYGWISIVALLYLFPVAVFVEGPQWAEGFRRAVAAVPTPWTFYAWVLLSGVFYHLYNQSSYQALDRISPLTFSVGNTMKRVVVIIASVLVFRNPIRPLNALGSGIAILGTFLYSQATATATAVGQHKKRGEGGVKKS